jgi:triosephosphate isomerase (TIM)
MRTKLIAGNWKMHGSKPEIRSLISGILARLDPARSAEVMVLPPFPYIPLVQSLIDNTPVQLGAQDLSAHDAGAYTGDVSGVDAGRLGLHAMCWLGIPSGVGLHGETSDQVAGQVRGGPVPVCSRSCAWARRWRIARPGRTDGVVGSTDRVR